MSSKKREQKTYLKQYPETGKWLNQCVVCGSVGYKPEMPEKIYPGELAQNLRKLFSSLAINEISMCEDCARNWEQSI